VIEQQYVQNLVQDLVFCPLVNWLKRFSNSEIHDNHLKSWNSALEPNMQSQSSDTSHTYLFRSLTCERVRARGAGHGGPYWVGSGTSPLPGAVYALPLAFEFAFPVTLVTQWVPCSLPVVSSSDRPSFLQLKHQYQQVYLEQPWKNRRGLHEQKSFLHVLSKTELHEHTHVQHARQHADLAVYNLFNLGDMGLVLPSFFFQIGLQFLAPLHPGQRQQMNPC
jgi:hypothetical protein